jgi:hypothetical protein
LKNATTKSEKNSALERKIDFFTAPSITFCAFVQTVLFVCAVKYSHFKKRQKQCAEKNKTGKKDSEREA